MSQATIEFTDRYGPAGHPPWVIGCHGPCEAMGFYPEDDPSRWPADVRPLGEPEEDGAPDDGWRFIRCPDCGGTGRVSLGTTLRRVPRWLARGLRQVPELARREIHHPQASPLERWRLALWTCLGRDLAWLWHRMRARTVA